MKKAINIPQNYSKVLCFSLSLCNTVFYVCYYCFVTHEFIG